MILSQEVRKPDVLACAIRSVRLNCLGIAYTRLLIKSITYVGITLTERAAPYNLTHLRALESRYIYLDSYIFILNCKLVRQ